MKRHLVAWAHEVDAFCNKLTDGLTIVAVMLGFLVVTMSVVRVQQIVPDLFASVPLEYETAMEQ